MLETSVSRVLSLFLREYFEEETFKKSNFNLGLIGGCLILENLSIRPNALDALQLPVEIIHGIVGRFEFNGPSGWGSSIWSLMSHHGEPFILLLDGIQLVIRSKWDAWNDPSFRATQAKASKKAHLATADFFQNQSSSTQNPSWFGGITHGIFGRLVDNFEIHIKNIHIRFEDEISNPQTPYFCGVTLRELSVQTAKRSSNQQGQIVAKSIKLEELAFYWNPKNSEHLSSMPLSNLSLREKFTILSSMVHPEEYSGASMHQNFIVAPFNLNANVAISLKTSIQSIPLLSLDLNIPDIKVTFKDVQYQGVLSLISALSKLQGGIFTGMETRPAQRPAEIPREWWKYAFKRINLHLDNQRKHKAFTWQRVAERMAQRRAYVALWRRTGKAKVAARGKGAQALTEAEQAELDRLEEELPIEAILFFRWVTERELLKEMQEAGAGQATNENKSTTWAEWLLGSNAVVSQEELEKMKKTLDIDPTRPMIVASLVREKDEPLLTVQVKLDQLSATLLATSSSVGHRDQASMGPLPEGTPLIQAKLAGLATDVEVKGCGKTQNIQLALDLADFEIAGVEAKEKEGGEWKMRKILSQGQQHLKRLQERDKFLVKRSGPSMRDLMPQPLFHVAVETFPDGSDLGAHVSGAVGAVQIVVSPGAQWLYAVGNFFEAPAGLIEVEKLEAFAMKHLATLTSQAETRLDALLSQRFTVFLDLHIQAPILIIPQDPKDPDLPAVAINLGTIHVQSGSFAEYGQMKAPELTKLVKEQSLKKDQGVTEGKDSESPSRRRNLAWERERPWDTGYYDHIEVQITGVRFILSSMREALFCNWQNSSVSKEGCLVDAFDIDLDLWVSAVMEDPTLPQIRAQGELNPGIQINLSNTVVSQIETFGRTLMDQISKAQVSFTELSSNTTLARMLSEMAAKQNSYYSKLYSRRHRSASNSRSSTLNYGTPENSGSLANSYISHRDSVFSDDRDSFFSAEEDIGGSSLNESAIVHAEEHQKPGSRKDTLEEGYETQLPPLSTSLFACTFKVHHIAVVFTLDNPKHSSLKPETLASIQIQSINNLCELGTHETCALLEIEGLFVTSFTNQSSPEKCYQLISTSKDSQHFHSLKKMDLKEPFLQFCYTGTLTPELGRSQLETHHSIDLKLTQLEIVIEPFCFLDFLNGFIEFAPKSLPQNTVPPCSNDSPSVSHSSISLPDLFLHLNISLSAVKLTCLHGEEEMFSLSLPEVSLPFHMTPRAADVNLYLDNVLFLDLQNKGRRVFTKRENVSSLVHGSISCMHSEKVLSARGNVTVEASCIFVDTDFLNSLIGYFSTASSLVMKFFEKLETIPQAEPKHHGTNRVLKENSELENETGTEEPCEEIVQTHEDSFGEFDESSIVNEVDNALYLSEENFEDAIHFSGAGETSLEEEDSELKAEESILSDNEIKVSLDIKPSPSSKPFANTLIPMNIDVLFEMKSAEINVAKTTSEIEQESKTMLVMVVGGLIVSFHNYRVSDTQTVLSFELALMDFSLSVRSPEWMVLEPLSARVLAVAPLCPALCDMDAFKTEISALTSGNSQVSEVISRWQFSAIPPLRPALSSDRALQSQVHVAFTSISVSLANLAFQVIDNIAGAILSGPLFAVDPEAPAPTGIPGPNATDSEIRPTSDEPTDMLPLLNLLASVGTPSDNSYASQNPLLLTTVHVESIALALAPCTGTQIDLDRRITFKVLDVSFAADASGFFTSRDMKFGISTEVTIRSLECAQAEQDSLLEEAMNTVPLVSRAYADRLRLLPGSGPCQVVAVAKLASGDEQSTVLLDIGPTRVTACAPTVLGLIRFGENAPKACPRLSSFVNSLGSNASAPTTDQALSEKDWKKEDLLDFLTNSLLFLAVDIKVSCLELVAPSQSFEQASLKAIARLGVDAKAAITPLPRPPLFAQYGEGKMVDVQLKIEGMEFFLQERIKRKPIKRELGTRDKEGAFQNINRSDVLLPFTMHLGYSTTLKLSDDLPLRHKFWIKSKGLTLKLSSDVELLMLLIEELFLRFTENLNPQLNQEQFATHWGPCPINIPQKLPSKSCDEGNVHPLISEPDACSFLLCVMELSHLELTVSKIELNMDVLGHSNVPFPLLRLHIAPQDLSLVFDQTKLTAKVQCLVSLEYFHQELVAWEPLIEPWSFVLMSNVDLPMFQLKNENLPSEVCIRLKCLSSIPLSLNLTEMLLKSALHAMTLLIKRSPANEREKLLVGSLASHVWLKNESGMKLCCILNGNSPLPIHVNDGVLIPLDEDIFASEGCLSLQRKWKSVDIVNEKSEILGSVDLMNIKNQDINCVFPKKQTVEFLHSSKESNKGTETVYSGLIVSCKCLNGFKLLEIRSPFQLQNLLPLELLASILVGEGGNLQNWSCIISEKEIVSIPSDLLQESYVQLGLTMKSPPCTSTPNSNGHFEEVCSPYAQVRIPLKLNTEDAKWTIVEFQSDQHKNDMMYACLALLQRGAIDTVSVAPPVVIENLLGCAVDLELISVGSNQQVKGHLEKGQNMPVLCFSPEAAFTLQLTAKNFYSTCVISISACKDSRERKHKLKVPCKNSSGKELILDLDILEERKVRRLSLYAAFWIFNQTKRTIEIVHTSQSSSLWKGNKAGGVTEQIEHGSLPKMIGAFERKVYSEWMSIRTSGDNNLWTGKFLIKPRNPFVLNCKEKQVGISVRRPHIDHDTGSNKLFHIVPVTVSIQKGKGKFHRTMMINFKPALIVLNKLPIIIKARQFSFNHKFTFIRPEEWEPIILSPTLNNNDIEIQSTNFGCDSSVRIEMTTPCSYFRFQDRDRQQVYFFQSVVVYEQNRHVVTLLPLASHHVPHKVENKSTLDIFVRQAFPHGNFEHVLPFHSLPFVWDHGNLKNPALEVWLRNWEEEKLELLGQFQFTGGRTLQVLKNGVTIEIFKEGVLDILSIRHQNVDHLGNDKIFSASNKKKVSVKIDSAVEMEGLFISLITQQRLELFCLSLHGVLAQFRHDELQSDETLQFSIQSIQIDNYVPYAKHDIFLASPFRSIKRDKSLRILLHRNLNIEEVVYFLDIHFAPLLMNLDLSLPLELWFLGERLLPEFHRLDVVDEGDCIDAWPVPITSDAETNTLLDCQLTAVQFERIRIQPPEIYCSFFINPWLGKQSAALFTAQNNSFRQSSHEHYLWTLFWGPLVATLVNINKAHFKFSNLTISSFQEFMNENHKQIMGFCKGAIFQFFKLPGNLECIGCPNLFVSDVTDRKDNGVCTATSVSRETSTLITGNDFRQFSSKVLVAYFSVAERFFEHNLLCLASPSLLCLDFGYMRLVPSNTFDGLLQGIVGILREPLFWYSAKGCSGLGIGMITGLLGAPVKVYSGTMNMLASRSQRCRLYFQARHKNFQQHLQCTPIDKAQRIFNVKQLVLQPHGHHQTLRVLSRETVGTPCWFGFFKTDKIFLEADRIFAVDKRLPHILRWETLLCDILSIDISNNRKAVFDVILDVWVPCQQTVLQDKSKLRYEKLKIHCENKLQQHLFLTSIATHSCVFFTERAKNFL